MVATYFTKGATMTAFLAPALVTLRNEINALNPKRDKSSDGWIGDAAHATRESQHNPEVGGKYAGRVDAIDVDEDGIDAYAILEKIKADPRTWYVIYEGFIYSRTRGFRKEEYNGASPHDKHFHVSIYPGRDAGQDGTTWNLGKAKPAPKPPVKPTVPVVKYLKLAAGVKPNARHAQVKDLQRLLLKAGYGPIKGSVTTFYGDNTIAAVVRFHKANPQFASSKQDGVIGPKGFEHLQKEAE